MKVNLYSSMLSGFSLFYVNSQHELWWKKKKITFGKITLVRYMKSWASLVIELVRQSQIVQSVIDSSGTVVPY